MNTWIQEKSEYEIGEAKHVVRKRDELDEEKASALIHFL
jgi:hypothetical protein